MYGVFPRSGDSKANKKLFQSSGAQSLVGDGLLGNYNSGNLVKEHMLYEVKVGSYLSSCA